MKACCTKRMMILIFGCLTKVLPARSLATAAVAVRRWAPHKSSLPAWPLSLCGALLARWCCSVKTPTPTDFTFSAPHPTQRTRNERTNNRSHSRPSAAVTDSLALSSVRGRAPDQCTGPCKRKWAPSESVGMSHFGR